MTREEGKILVRLEERLDTIHDILKGDDGLCKRVSNVEKDITKAKGWAAGISTAVSIAMYWLGRKL